MMMGSITSLPLKQALYYLRKENVNPKLLSHLQPPEYLCRQKMNGTIKDYKIILQDENDPLFESINRIMNLVKEQMTDCTKASSQQFQRVLDFYQTYIQQVCQSTGKQRSLFLKGEMYLNPNDGSLLEKALLDKEDELAYSLISLNQQPFIVPAEYCETDLEKFYDDWLFEAEQQKNMTMQVMILEKTSDFYISEKRRKTTIYPNDYATAAYILNIALALAQAEKIHPVYVNHIMDKMELLEQYAFRAFCQKEKPNEKLRSIVGRRNALQEIRTSVKKKVDEKISIYTILSETTDHLREFFASLIRECIHFMGPPKTSYAFIGLGSMARNEMCPYSDLEFAVLIDKPTEENKTYFRNLVRFLEIRMINLGEAEYSIGREIKFSTPHGFSLDRGGNVPIGGAWELINSPEQLAKYQSLQSLHENLVTSNALTTVCLITSNEGKNHSSLCERYRHAVKKQLEAYVDGSWFSLDEKERIYHRRALILLKEHLQGFELNLSAQKEK